MPGSSFFFKKDFIPLGFRFFVAGYIIQPCGKMAMQASNSANGSAFTISISLSGPSSDMNDEKFAKIEMYVVLRSQNTLFLSMTIIFLKFYAICMLS